MDCLFCKIIKSKTPAKIIYRDELVIAFDDLHPQAPHHKLIVPFKHISTLNDLTAEDTTLTGHMIHVAKDLAQTLNISSDGYRVVMNCNSNAGQTIFHIHMHMLGGRRLAWPPG
jgi:histidine triad (HIT) family protein